MILVPNESSWPNLDSEVKKSMWLTTPDHVVDHKWPEGEPRLSWYILVSKSVIFQGERVDGTRLDTRLDQFWPRGRPKVVIRGT